MNIKFTIPRPNDMHLHVRQGDMLHLVVPHTAAQFQRAIIMPNTSPPIISVDQASNYRDQILSAVPIDTEFEPMMTLYLSESITENEIQKAKDSGFVHGVKLYPFGVTTNSEHGVQNLNNVDKLLKKMEEINLPLLVHGEDANPDTDVFEREQKFYTETLPDLISKYPNLRIVCEHITTKIAANFIQNAPENIGATITPQHLLCDRNDMLGNGIKPHLYCKPILKKQEDKAALLDLVLSGHPRVFAGTDSAPHTKDNKECACGCAGVYSAYSAIELYAEAFDKKGDLSKPETQALFTAFMSTNAANFYGFKESKETVTISNTPKEIPTEFISVPGEIVIPWRAGEQVEWTTS